MKFLKHAYHHHLISRTLFIALVILIHSSPGQAENKLPIRHWLMTDVLAVNYPAFHEQKNEQGNKFDLASLLTWPQDEVLNWWPDKSKMTAASLQWQTVMTDSGNCIQFLSQQKDIPELCYLATYVDVERWLKAKLSISSPHPFQIFLNGQFLESKPTSSDKKDERSQQVEKEIKLERGKHLILLKSLKDPQNENTWSILATISTVDSQLINYLSVSTSPARHLNIERMLNSPSIRSIDLSSDGQLVAIGLTRLIKPTDKSDSWLEVHEIKSSKLLQEFKDGYSISAFQWAPRGRSYAFSTSGKEGYNLWVGDWQMGTQELLLRDMKGLGDFHWAPDNSYLIYSLQDEVEEETGALKKLEGMEDRWPWWKNRSFLYLVNLKTKHKKRLTAGLYSTSLQAIHPNGSEIIFSITKPDYSERPYSKTILYRLNLKSMITDTLLAERFINTVEYSPDGKKLLVTGGPSLFGGLGINVSEDRIPNDYDIQAYIFDLNSGEIEPITKNFDPSILQAVWNLHDGMIYFVVIEKSYRNLYRYDSQKKQFQKIMVGVEVLDDFDLAFNADWAIYKGTSATVPEQLFSLNLKNLESTRIRTTEEPELVDVQFGKVEPWTFRNDRNVEIEGHVYYPPQFEAAKKYPCIVYYYGGTSPVERDFGGRYPKNVWAANGYIVYVMQPSGAIGFGQNFSALHVNDWGRIVAAEIMEGVKQFIKAHPFIDPERVGCIGASYGGFMTMLLQTRTDLFACAVSHAGISSLASYWGEGYWGYSYSAVATANSFPWNRQDIYIEQSPLFSADKISKPLLLLHGQEDTNVPPGESIQLYTALKLLGKEVEYVEIAGQNHHIMEHYKRLMWTKTIMAWFDKYLKDQTEWWNDLYPLQ